MTTNLWSANDPSLFWQCQPDPSKEVWHAAISNAYPFLGLSGSCEDIDALLAMTIGEEQFGPDHWQLSQARRLYYLLKPLLPRALIDSIKKTNSRYALKEFKLRWPVEECFVRFQWEIIRQVLIILDQKPIEFKYFWPGDYQFAFVLTHDIESKRGLDFIPDLIELEEKLGFRSSFNFVPEGYPIDDRLLTMLRERGFEIGIHGLKHDGKLFSSKTMFMERAERINNYLRDYHAKGFRSPLTHRNPEWMQALEVDYDMSFFDTDPYEPLPGGTMSIWPFFIGRFVELPYTLIQDSTLVTVLGETTPRFWLQKLDFIKHHHGMALLNAHPDYLIDPKLWKIYKEFLECVKAEGGYWNALPAEVAGWWRIRTEGGASLDAKRIKIRTISLDGDQICID